MYGSAGVNIIEITSRAHGAAMAARGRMHVADSWVASSIVTMKTSPNETID
jgi:hypothetical protein